MHARPVGGAGVSAAGRGGTPAGDRLVVDGLHVAFAEFTLGPVDLAVGEGITAVLGPNGSGKTTMLKAMNGLVPGAAGSVRFDEVSLRDRTPEALRRCAFVPDGDEFLFPELSLHEFWGFYADIRERTFGESRAALLDVAHGYAERLALDPGAVRMGEFSLGMRRKTQLITGLMTTPDLLMVDEPQNGLDFVSSHEVRRILSEVRDAGRVVVMSNHDLDSVARVADSIVILRAGGVVATSTRHFTSADECEAFVAGHFA